MHLLTPGHYGQTANLIYYVINIFFKSLADMIQFISFLVGLKLEVFGA